MREIKYRAWEKKLKEIIPVYDIKFDGNVGMINTRSAWRTFDEIELMQYTGLNDKRGVEIYDGDICTDQSGDIIEIVWNDKYQWGCKIIKGNILSQGCTFPLWQWNKCERNNFRVLTVIGNIYETPGLLQGVVI